MAVEVLVQAAYMTGDMFGVAAALKLDSTLRVLLVCDAADQRNVAKMLALYQQSERRLPAPSTVDRAYLVAAGRTTDQGRTNSLAIVPTAALRLITPPPVDATPFASRVRTLVVPNSRDFYKSFHEPSTAPSVRQANETAVRRVFGLKPTEWIYVKAMGYSTTVVANKFREEKTDKSPVHRLLSAQWEIPGFDELGIQRFLNRKGLVSTGRYAFIWIRQSGRTGGAHPELDAARSAWIQLIDGLGDGIVPVVIGDRFPDMDGLSLTGKKVLNLTHFWEEMPFFLYNPPPDVLARLPRGFATAAEGRRSQFVLFSYLQRAGYKVVHVGMRSGVLESVALMGQTVMYLEDAGNQQRARIENLTKSMRTEREIRIRPVPRRGPKTTTEYTTGTFQRMEIAELPIERGWAARNAIDARHYTKVGDLARLIGEHPRDISQRIRATEGALAAGAGYAAYESTFVLHSKPVWKVRYPGVATDWAKYKRDNAGWWNPVAAKLAEVHALWASRDAVTAGGSTFKDTDLLNITAEINRRLA